MLKPRTAQSPAWHGHRLHSITLAVLVIVAAACGDNAQSLPAQATAAQCERVVVAGEPFTTANQFGDQIAGTLAQWEPQGRWFTEGGGFYRSTIFLARRDFSNFAVDGKTVDDWSLDADQLFARQKFDDQIIAIRVSNRQSDGALRLQRAECINATCDVCTYTMRAAAWRDGESESQGISLISEFSPSRWIADFRDMKLRNVRISDNVAYVATTYGIDLVDISDLRRPRMMNHWPSGFTNDLKVFEVAGRRYVANIGDNAIVDCTDPTMLRQVATIPRSYAAHTLFAETRNGKSYLYFSGVDGTASIFDVSDPANPQHLGAFATGASGVHDLVVDNGIAYINAWEKGLFRVDFTDPANPRATGHWPGTTHATSHSSWTTIIDHRPLVLHGDEAEGAYLSVVDAEPISKTFMTEIGYYQSRSLTSIHNVMAFGTHAYVSHYQDGVRIIDLKDPAQPVLAAYFNTWRPNDQPENNTLFAGAIGIDVDPVRHLLFVVDNPRGLLILSDDTAR